MEVRGQAVGAQTCWQVDCWWGANESTPPSERNKSRQITLPARWLESITSGPCASFPATALPHAARAAVQEQPERGRKGQVTGCEAAPRWGRSAGRGSSASPAPAWRQSPERLHPGICSPAVCSHLGSRWISASLLGTDGHVRKSGICFLQAVSAWLCLQPLRVAVEFGQLAEWKVRSVMAPAQHLSTPKSLFFSAGKACIY